SRERGRAAMAAPWLLLLLLAAPAAVQGSGCRAGARGVSPAGPGDGAVGGLRHANEGDDSVHFRKRGSLTWNVQDGTVSLTQRQLTEDERGRLRDVAALNGLYRVRVPRKPGTTEGPATAGHVSSFVPAVSPPGSPCLCRGRGWSPPVPCLGGGPPEGRPAFPTPGSQLPPSPGGPFLALGKRARAPPGPSFPYPPGGEGARPPHPRPSFIPPLFHPLGRGQDLASPPLLGPQGPFLPGDLPRPRAPRQKPPLPL
uniref:ER membrane protein complex subunit 10 n=1 Tax=Sarcophilus harrisii TaxID=9305 RepID=A0A7N4PHN6_SARHA